MHNKLMAWVIRNKKSLILYLYFEVFIMSLIISHIRDDINKIETKFAIIFLPLNQKSRKKNLSAFCGTTWN